MEAPLGPIVSSIAPTPQNPLLRRGRPPKTATVTETVTIDRFYVSYAPTPEPQTITNTVFKNVTIYSHNTVTHNAMVTVHQPIDRPVTTTISASTACLSTPMAAAQATLAPVPVHQGHRKMSTAAIVATALGVVIGLALLLAAGWCVLRKWRVWKAKGSQRMKGVELQRRWEREQEAERTMRELGVA
ncbi:MAG: hypothetical protein Q9201_001993 [Fulgogasparrea decipioides]